MPIQKPNFKPTEIKKLSIPKNKLGAWMTNFGKSIGYSAQDVLTDIIPAGMEMAMTTSDAIKDFRTKLINFRQSDNRLGAELDKIDQVKQVKEALGSYKDALKTGKFWDSTHDETPDEDFGFDDGDFGFDDSDFGGDFDLDVSDGEDSGTFETEDSNGNVSVTHVNVKADIGEDSPIIKTIDNQTKVSMEGTVNMLEQSKGQNLLLMTQFSQLDDKVTGGFAALNENVTTITTAMPVITQYAAASEKYYSDSIDIFNKLYDAVNSIRGSIAAPEEEGNFKQATDVLDLFSSNGVLNFDDYKDIVKKQFRNAVQGNFILQQVSNMFTDQDNLKIMLEQPLRIIPDAIVNAIIKPSVQVAVKGFNDALSNFQFALLNKLRGEATADSSNPILRFLGSVFGLGNKLDTAIDRTAYKRGRIDWDGESKKTLVEVIPFYLRKIASALTGTNEIAFDYNAGSFRQVRDMASELDIRREKYLTDPAGDMISQHNTVVDKKMIFASRKQRDDYKDNFKRFMIQLAKRNGNQLETKGPNGFLNSIAQIMGTNTDNPYAREIAAYFNAMSEETSGRNMLLELPKLLNEGRMKRTRETEAINRGEITTNDMYIGNGTGYDENMRRNRKGKITDVVNYDKSVLGGNRDKYGNSSVYYLRNILDVLTTGIKVYSVGQPTLKQLTPVYRGKKLVAIDTNYEYPDRQTPKQSLHEKVNRIRQELISQEKKYSDARDVESRENNGAYDSAKQDKKKAKNPGMIDMRQDANMTDMKAMESRFRDQITADVNETKEEDSKLMDWFKRVTGLNNDDPLTKFINKIGRSAEKPSETLMGLFKNADKLLFRLVYGGGDTNNLSFMQQAKLTLSKAFKGMAKIFNSAIGKFQELVFGDDGLISQIKQTKFGTEMKVYYEKLRSFIFGTKNATTGVYENGLFSETLTELSSIGRDFKASMFTDDDSVFNNVKESVTNKIDGAMQILGLSRSSGEIDPVTGKPKGMLTNILDSVHDTIVGRAKSFSDDVFGVDTERGKFIREVRTDLVGKKGKLGAGAVLGILGSMFMPWGPVGGAFLGIGKSAVQESKTLNKLLFGYDNSETGEHKKGIINQQLVDLYNNNKTGIRIGVSAGVLASIGLIPSMFAPMGPVGGALLGLGISAGYNSDLFQDFLYGPKDAQGNHMGDGFADKFKHQFGSVGKHNFIDAGIGAGVGLMGSFFLPGGPILPALGAIGGLASSTEGFKRFMFGDYADPNDHSKGRKHDGFVNKLMQPALGAFKKAQIKFMGYLERKIMIPLTLAMKPIAQGLKNVMKSIKGIFVGIADSFKEIVIAPIGKTVKTYFIDPMKKMANTLFKGMLKAIGAVVAAPFRVLELMSFGLDRRHRKKGDARHFSNTVGAMFTGKDADGNNVSSIERLMAGFKFFSPSGLAADRQAEGFDNTKKRSKVSKKASKGWEQYQLDNMNNPDALDRESWYRQNGFIDIFHRNKKEKKKSNKQEQREVNINNHGQASVIIENPDMIRASNLDPIEQKMDRIVNSLDLLATAQDNVDFFGRPWNYKENKMYQRLRNHVVNIGNTEYTDWNDIDQYLSNGEAPIQSPNKNNGGRVGPTLAQQARERINKKRGNQYDWENSYSNEYIGSHTPENDSRETDSASLLFDLLHGTNNESEAGFHPHVPNPGAFIRPPDGQAAFGRKINKLGTYVLSPGEQVIPNPSKEQQYKDDKAERNYIDRKYGKGAGIPHLAEGAFDQSSDDADVPELMARLDRLLDDYNDNSKKLDDAFQDTMHSSGGILDINDNIEGLNQIFDRVTRRVKKGSESALNVNIIEDNSERSSVIDRFVQNANALEGNIPSQDQELANRRYIIRNASRRMNNPDKPDQTHISNQESYGRAIDKINKWDQKDKESKWADAGIKPTDTGMIFGPTRADSKRLKKEQEVAEKTKAKQDRKDAREKATEEKKAQKQQFRQNLETKNGFAARMKQWKDDAKYEEQTSIWNKIRIATEGSWETSKAYVNDWKKMFGKKGLIAIALLAAVPIISRLYEGIKPLIDWIADKLGLKGDSSEDSGSDSISDAGWIGSVIGDIATNYGNVGGTPKGVWNHTKKDANDLKTDLLDIIGYGDYGDIDGDGTRDPLQDRLANYYMPFDSETGTFQPDSYSDLKLTLGARGAVGLAKTGLVQTAAKGLGKVAKGGVKGAAKAYWSAVKAANEPVIALAKGAKKAAGSAVNGASSLFKSGWKGAGNVIGATTDVTGKLVSGMAGLGENNANEVVRMLQENLDVVNRTLAADPGNKAAIKYQKKLLSKMDRIGNGKMLMLESLDDLGKGASKIGKKIPGFVETGLNLPSTVGNKLRKSVVDNLTAASRFTRTSGGTALIDDLGKNKGVFSVAKDAIKGTAQTAVGAIDTGATKAANWAGGKIANTGLGKAVAGSGLAKTIASSKAGTAITAMTTGQETIGKKITSIFSGIYNAIGNSKLLKGIKGIGPGIQKGVKGLIDKTFGSMTKFINGCGTKIMEKASTKLGKGLGSALAKASPLGIAFVGFGLINGAASAANLFQVDDQYVTGKMRIISSLFKGLLNSTPGMFIDIINEVMYSVTGVNFVRELAIIIYNLISSEEDSEKLTEGIGKFQEQYDAKVEQEYNDFIQTEDGQKWANENGIDISQGYTEEVAQAWKESGKATTMADYNAKQHQTLGTKIASKATTTIRDVMNGKLSKNVFSKDYWQTTEGATDEERTAEIKDKIIQAPLMLMGTVGRWVLTSVKDLVKGIGGIGKGIGTDFAKVFTTIHGIGDVFNGSFWGVSTGDEADMSGSAQGPTPQDVVGNFAKIARFLIKPITFPLAIVVGLGKTIWNGLKSLLDKAIGLSLSVEDQTMGFDDITGISTVFSKEWWSIPESTDDGMGLSPLKRAALFGMKVMQFIPGLFIGVARSIGKIPIIQKIGNMIQQASGIDPDGEPPTDADGNPLSPLAMAAYWGAKIVQVPIKLIVDTANFLGPKLKPIFSAIGSFIVDAATDVVTAISVTDNPLGIFTKEYWTMQEKDYGDGGSISTIRKIGFYTGRVLLLGPMVVIGIIRKIGSGISGIVDDIANFGAKADQLNSDLEIDMKSPGRTGWTEYWTRPKDADGTSTFGPLFTVAWIFKRLLSFPAFAIKKLMASIDNTFVGDAINWIVGKFNSDSRGTDTNGNNNVDTQDFNSKGGERLAVTTGGHGEMLNGIPYYSQNNVNFKDKAYRFSDTDGTTSKTNSEAFGDAGCGPTTMAMVNSAITNTPTDPLQLAQYATDAGYSTSTGTSSNYFGDIGTQLGMNVTETSPTEYHVQQLLGATGNPIIIQGESDDKNLPFTSGGHYVVGTRLTPDGKITINDPRGPKYSKDYNLNQVLSNSNRIWAFDQGIQPNDNDSLKFPVKNGTITEDDFAELLRGDGSSEYSAMAQQLWSAYYKDWNNYGEWRKTRHHGGDDLVKAKNSPIQSFTSGKVYATNTGIAPDTGSLGSTAGTGLGNWVKVLDENGHINLYGHMNGVNVSPNEHVSMGTQLGILGHTGSSTGPHLHYEVRNSATGGGWPNTSNPKDYIFNKYTTSDILGTSGQNSSTGTSDTTTDDSTDSTTTTTTESATANSLSSALSAVASSYAKPITEYLYGVQDSSTTTTSADSTSNTSTMTSTSSLSGNSNAEKIWHYLRSKGISEAGAAGAMGVWKAESGLIPNNLENKWERKYGSDTAYTDKVNNTGVWPDNGSSDPVGYGLAQWTYATQPNSRKNLFLNFAKSRGAKIDDLGMQLDWAMNELTTNSTYKQKAYDRIKNSSSPEDAALGMLTGYEMPAWSDSKGRSYAYWPQRKNNAIAYYNEFKGKGGQVTGSGNLPSVKINKSNPIHAVNSSNDKLLVKTINKGNSSMYYKSPRLLGVNDNNKTSSNYKIANKHSSMDTVVGGGTLDTSSLNSLSNDEIVTLLSDMLVELRGTNNGINKFNDKELKVVSNPINISDNSNKNTVNVNQQSKPTTTKQKSSFITDKNYSLAKQLATGSMAWNN